MISRLLLCLIIVSASFGIGSANAADPNSDPRVNVLVPGTNEILVVNTDTGKVVGEGYAFFDDSTNSDPVSQVMAADVAASWVCACSSASGACSKKQCDARKACYTGGSACAWTWVQ